METRSWLPAIGSDANSIRPFRFRLYLGRQAKMQRAQSDSLVLRDFPGPTGRAMSGEGEASKTPKPWVPYQRDVFEP